MIYKFLLYFRRNIPYINFCISLSALTFQVGILNPWHKYIDNKFNNIDKKYDTMINKIDIMNTKINGTINDTCNSSYNDKIDNITNKNNSIYYKNYKKISYKEY